MRFTAALCAFFAATHVLGQGPNRIGEFTLESAGSAKIIYNRTAPRAAFTLRGPHLVLRSALFELAAERIRGNVVQDKATGWRASDAVAEENVRILLQDEPNGRRHKLLCKKAVYTAGKTRDVGTIVMTGGVHYQLFDKSQGTSEMKADRGTLTITPEEFSVDLSDMDFTAQPAPKPEGKS